MASYRIVVTERTELVVDARSRREALAIAERVQQERGPLPAGCTISKRHGPTFECTAVTSLAPGRAFEEATDASHPGKWRVVRQ